MRGKVFALVCGAALLASASASAQDLPVGVDAAAMPVSRPAKQRYLSDVRLHREPLGSRMPAPVHRPRGQRPFPGPDVAYETHVWSDGAVRSTGWCFAADPHYRGLGAWVPCGGYSNF